MLSRVAESLYWTARYIERAENVTRLLDVTFHGTLDAQVADRGEPWSRLVTMLGSTDDYLEHYDEFTATTVGDWLLWHEENPNAVVSCVTLARENARSVREQISSEMWEAINSLFLLVGRVSRPGVSRGPHAFFEQVRNRTHLFQGTAAATMGRGQPYEFIQLGLHLERGDTTVRSIADRYPAAWALDVEDPARTRELAALLRSCSAFDAYVRQHGLRFEPLPVAEALIRSHDQPRSVLVCLQECLGSLGRIAGTESAQYRAIGRICADLEYGELLDTSGPGVRATLSALLVDVNRAAAEITRGFFSGQALPFAALSQQEAQQQQCG